tara:strand:- start:23 stop:205 length:183 start_codon:yes stop_codon:yes gene_type:complete
MALIINMVKTVVQVVVHLVEISRMVVREPLVKVMLVPVIRLIQPIVPVVVVVRVKLVHMV